MYKIGLKLWSTNKQYVHEAQRLFDQGFCNYIELFAVPGSFDEHIQLWAALKIPYVIHAPHSLMGLNLANKDAREHNKLLINETLKFADALKASTIIFHPGINGTIDETIYQVLTFCHSGQGPEIHNLPSRILIENKPYLGINNELCNGYSPEEIERVMTEAGVGFCLDLGHAVYAANYQKIDPIMYIKQFMNLQPKMFHLSDGDWNSVYDNHTHLGKGDFPLKDILKLLSSGSCHPGQGPGIHSGLASDAVISLETPHALQDKLDDFKEDVNFLRTVFQGLYALDLRPAQLTDVDDIFNLSNDALVRKNSFNQQVIVYDEHVSWYAKKLTDLDSVFFVARDLANCFVGYVRFEKKGDCDNVFVITIHIAEQFRGKGFGTFLIQKATQQFLKKHSNVKIIAYIKENNISSRKSFVKAGYSESGTIEIAQVSCFVFSKQF